MRFGLGFLQRLFGNFPQTKTNFEFRSGGTAPPAGDLPMPAYKFRGRRLRQIHQQRVLAQVELLRQRGHWFGLPRCSIGRGEQADFDGFLLHDGRDGERQQKNATGSFADVERRAVALGGDYGVCRYEEGIEHDSIILPKPAVGIRDGGHNRGLTSEQGSSHFGIATLLSQLMFCHVTTSKILFASSLGIKNN